jgi:dihydroorotase
MFHLFFSEKNVLENVTPHSSSKTRLFYAFPQNDEQITNMQFVLIPSEITLAVHQTSSHFSFDGFNIFIAKRCNYE